MDWYGNSGTLPPPLEDVELDEAVCWGADEVATCAVVVCWARVVEGTGDDAEVWLVVEMVEETVEVDATADEENSSTLFTPLSLTQRLPDESNAKPSGAIRRLCVAFQEKP